MGAEAATEEQAKEKGWAVGEKGEGRVSSRKISHNETHGDPLLCSWLDEATATGEF